MARARRIPIIDPMRHPLGNLLLTLFCFTPMVPAHAADTVTISLWHSFRGQEAMALETVVATFNEQHADRLVTRQIDGHRFNDIVEEAFQKNGGPDIVVWAHDKVGPWANRGFILPLDDLVDTDTLDLYIPNCLDAVRSSGRLYGLPLSFETLILYYNRNLVSRPPAATDELIEIARGISNPAEKRYGLVYERGNFYFHAIWLHGFGGRVFDEAGRFDVRSPAMIRSLEFARDLSATHRIIPDTVDWNVEIDLFNAGRAGMLISGPWAWGSLDWDSVPVGIAAMPVVSATNRFAAPFLGVKGFYINARSAHPRSSLAAMTHLTSAFSGCLMNVMAGYLPANRFAYEFNALAEHPITAKCEEQVDSTVLMPSSREMGYVWQVMIHDNATNHPGCLDRIFLEGVSAEDAAQEAWNRYQALAEADQRGK